MNTFESKKVYNEMMNKYYVTTDLKTSKIYIAPFGKAAQPHLILCDKKHKADDLCRKLNASLLKNPLNKGPFELIGKENVSFLPGEVEIYILI